MPHRPIKKLRDQMSPKLHVEIVRAEILRLRRAIPFHKFVLNMQSGDRVLIEHPENIAFDPRVNSRSKSLSIVTSKVHFFGTFDAVTSVVQADRNGPAAR